MVFDWAQICSCVVIFVDQLQRNCQCRKLCEKIAMPMQREPNHCTVTELANVRLMIWRECSLFEFRLSSFVFFHCVCIKQPQKRASYFDCFANFSRNMSYWSLPYIRPGQGYYKISIIPQSLLLFHARCFRMPARWAENSYRKHWKLTLKLYWTKCFFEYSRRPRQTEQQQQVLCALGSSFRRYLTEQRLKNEWRYCSQRPHFIDSLIEPIPSGHFDVLVFR